MKNYDVDLGYVVLGKYKDGGLCSVGYDRHDSGTPYLGYGNLADTWIMDIGQTRSQLDYMPTMQSYSGGDKMEIDSFGIYPITVSLFLESVKPLEAKTLLMAQQTLAEIEHKRNSNELTEKQAGLLRTIVSLPELIIDFESAADQMPVGKSFHTAVVHTAGHIQYVHNKGLDYGGFHGKRGPDEYELVDMPDKATRYETPEKAAATLGNFTDRHNLFVAKTFLTTPSAPLTTQEIGTKLREIEEQEKQKALELLSPEAQKFIKKTDPKNPSL